MENFTNRKTENQMIAELQQLREQMMESSKQVFGLWTQRILSERTA